MFNSNIPTQAELPTSAQLLRSTAIAIVTAAVLLVTVVLPSEYAIDPTGVGKALGLTEMGEIKAELAAEAEADAKADKEKEAPQPNPDQRSDAGADDLLTRLANLIVPPAAAATLPVPDRTSPIMLVAGKTDEMTVTLAPGKGAEVKVAMKEGAKLRFSWTVEGGVVNFDTHGESFAAPDKTHSYEKGRGVANDEGELVAAFDGKHGWFWRNRGDKDVTVTVRATGDYTDFKRVM